MKLLVIVKTKDEPGNIAATVLATKTEIDAFIKALTTPKNFEIKVCTPDGKRDLGIKKFNNNEIHWYD